MKITDVMTITELSRLTGKTRPTLYKYVNDYENKNYDDIPYSFKKLFDLMIKENTTRSDIVDYCNRRIKKGKENDKTKELMDMILKNKDKINIDKIIEMVKEDLKWYLSKIRKRSF